MATFTYFANPRKKEIARRSSDGDLAVLTHIGWWPVRRVSGLNGAAVEESESDDAGVAEEEALHEAEELSKKTPWREISAKRAEIRLARWLHPTSIRAKTIQPTPRERFDRFIRAVHLFRPRLPWGAPDGVTTKTLEAGAASYQERFKNLEGKGLDSRISEAQSGYQDERDRSSLIEQRATYFLGAAGLTSSLMLTNGGLILGQDALSTTELRLVAIIALGLATLAAMMAGFRAIQAAMLTFGRAYPNSRSKISRRTKMSEEEAKRDLLASYMVGHRRLWLITNWKLDRFVLARRYFRATVILVVVVAGLFAGEAFGKVV